jgi:hypothetical protein
MRRPLRDAAKGVAEVSPAAFQCPARGRGGWTKQGGDSILKGGVPPVGVGDGRRRWRDAQGIEGWRHLCRPRSDVVTTSVIPAGDIVTTA